MNIKITKKGKQKMEFILEGASIPFANALRRIMISEIPVLAVEWIDITENSSAVFDEMIAQRTGLIPLDFQPDKFNLPNACKCAGKGCTLCQAVFALEKKGPGMVYSGDMKSANKSVKPSNPKFPILELLENQKVKFEATAILGTGKDHAKFQAANAVYQNYPELKGDEINTQPDKFLFKVESISGLPTDYIISKAGEILEEKAKEFKKEAAKL